MMEGGSREGGRRGRREEREERERGRREREGGFKHPTLKIPHLMQVIKELSALLVQMLFTRLQILLADHGNHLEEKRKERCDAVVTQGYDGAK